jgi:ABC-type Zn uptake system ZnuABC Zn-binding protein ZnuA
VMMPPGVDPHHFEPSARQLAELSRADLLFINGLGLETFMESFLARLNQEDEHTIRIIEVSRGITPLTVSPVHTHEEDEHGHHDHDPHVWTDPRNVSIWADNIAAALTELIPENADVFRERAEIYKNEMEQLDAWITERLRPIPPEKRLLVTDHSMLGYFAARYHFEQSGMILPGYSTAAEPSARELAHLNNIIRENNIRTIFVGSSANPVMADRIARDTGARVEIIYSGTLGGPGSGVESYIEYMKFNVQVIAGALQ